MNPNNAGATMVPSYAQNSVAAQRAHAAAQAAAGYTYPQQTVPAAVPSVPTTLPPAVAMTTSASIPTAPMTNTTALHTPPSSSAVVSASSSSNTKNNISSSNNSATNGNDTLLWQLDLQGIERWIRSINALFPKKPRMRIDPTTGQLIINPGTPGKLAQFHVLLKNRLVRRSSYCKI